MDASIRSVEPVVTVLLRRAPLSYDLSAASIVFENNSRLPLLPSEAWPPHKEGVAMRNGRRPGPPPHFRPTQIPKDPNLNPNAPA